MDVRTVGFKTLLNLLMKGLMILSLITSPLAFAKDSSSTQELIYKSESSLKRLFKTNPKLKSIAAKSSHGVKALSHPLQTMMLIWILAGVETYRQQHHLGPLNESEFDSKVLLDIADLLINDMELYSGMVGASAISAPLSKPLAELRMVLENKVSRKLFVEFLHSGAVSFVTFVGWEASSQLWKEAIFHLPEEKIETAETLRFTEIFTGRASREQREVFRSVLSNAFEILTLQRPAQARDWIYNTWRLRLATGEFLTLVTGMVGGSVVAGSMLSPGAGTLAGLFVGTLGGLLGGALTLALPESWKSAITTDIRSVRSGYNQRVLLTYDIYLREVGRRFRADQLIQQPPASYMVEGRWRETTSALKNKRHHRNKAFTAIFEDVYDSKVKLQEALMLHALSMEKLTAIRSLATSQKELEKLENLIEESSAIIQSKRTHIVESFAELLEIIDGEYQSISRLLEREDLFYPSSFRSRILKELNQLSGLREQIQLIAQGTLPGEFNYYSLSDEDLKTVSLLAGNYLNISHARGFKEEWFDE